MDFQIHCTTYIHTVFIKLYADHHLHSKFQILLVAPSIATVHQTDLCL